jgi:hypothetical protein
LCATKKSPKYLLRHGNFPGESGITVDAFLGELLADLRQKKNAHGMGKPATDSQIAAWQKKRKFRRKQRTSR